MNNVTFYRLVENAIKGDTQAFEELYEQKFRHILYYANSIMANQAESEDVAQETVVKMYRNINTLRDPKLFNSWLRSIIVNECRMMIRKNHMERNTLDIKDYEDLMPEKRMEFLPEEGSVKLK